MNKKVLLSWSTGKDSAYALHKLKQMADVEVAGIFTLINERDNCVTMHGTPLTLVHEQAKQLGLPVQVIAIPDACVNEIYEQRMGDMVANALSNDITHMAFGDLYLQEVRTYRETKLKGSGIEPLFPLWGCDTQVLSHAMIDAGFKAMISCIDTRKLDASFIGREYNKALLEDLPVTVDPCAENGEFQTFIFNTHLFKNEISVRIKNTIERDYFLFADFVYEERKH